MEHNAPETGEAVNVTALTAVDRCDRCGAQAYVRTVHDMSEDDRWPDDDRLLYMLWCAHHAREHKVALEPHVVANHLDRLEPAKEAATA